MKLLLREEWVAYQVVREIEHGLELELVPRVDRVIEAVVDPVREVVVFLVVHGRLTEELYIIQYGAIHNYFIL